MESLELKDIDGKRLFRISQHPEHTFRDGEAALKWASDNNVSVKHLYIPEIESILCQN